MGNEPAHARARERQLLGVALGGWPAHAHIGAWIDQELVYEPRAAAITRFERDDRREVAAGAVAADREAPGIDAEPRCVGGNPPRRGDGILRGGGKFVLGCEPIVDGDDETRGGVGERSADLVVALEVADHPAPAVEVDERRLKLVIGHALATIEPERDRAGWPHGFERDHLRDRLGVGLQNGARSQVRLARFGRRQRLDRRAPRGDDQIAHLLCVGMQLLLSHARSPSYVARHPRMRFTCPDSSVRRRPRARPS